MKSIKKASGIFFIIILLASSLAQAVFLSNQTGYTVVLVQFEHHLCVLPWSEGGNVEVTLEDEIWIYALKEKKIKFSYKSGFLCEALKIEQQGKEIVFSGERCLLYWEKLFQVPIESKISGFCVTND